MADQRKTIEELNLIYSRLREKAVRLSSTLKRLNADVCWGWYAGHNADIKGVSFYEEFPIPVVTINDVCEIGVDIRSMYIEGKIFIAEADSFDFSMLAGYDFCVYGASSYMNMLYDSRIAGLEELEDVLFDYEGEDSELCIDLLFPATPKIGAIVEACALLRALGTHIVSPHSDELGDCFTEDNEEVFD